MLRRWAPALILLGLTGCITPLPDLTQSRSPCREEPGGWCDFVREAAQASYAYAMLSSNAYQDEDTYTAIPKRFLPVRAEGNDKKGLAYSIYDRFADGTEASGKPVARVIAFRGTEKGSFSDVFSGSLGAAQRERALALYESERAALDAKGWQDVAIEVTGHSLGGALSTQVSIMHPEVKAYVFNTSPFFTGDPMLNDTNRLAIAERFEFLKALRRYKRSPAASEVVINCNPSASSGSKHSIRKLADCLTWIAAYGDSEALGLLGPNRITKPEVECGDANKVHPGKISQFLNSGERLPMCDHSPKLAEDTKS